MPGKCLLIEDADGNWCCPLRLLLFIQMVDNGFGGISQSNELSTKHFFMITSKASYSGNTNSQGYGFKPTKENQVSKTAADTTVVHSPFLSPSADCVM